MRAHRLLFPVVGGLLAASSFTGITLTFGSQAAAVRTSPSTGSVAVSRPVLPSMVRQEFRDEEPITTVAAPVTPRAVPVRTVAPRFRPVVRVAAPVVSAGVYSFSALESLWVSVGGPPSAEAQAAQIALCESGGRPWAHNPSGASGLWQILGAVVPGNLFDPVVNAENAVRKFRDSGGTFAQWVCR